MDDREATLGYKPQKEIQHNTLLPYADRLDDESIDQLARIKANLARAVQLRDIIGASHWSSMPVMPASYSLEIQSVTKVVCCSAFM